MTFRNPFPTVDVIIEYEGTVLLIERKNEPIGWALPGGFVDYGERVEDAAIREVKEETSLDVVLTDLLYVYSNPQRDARQHNLSVVFTAELTSDATNLRAQDDARAAKFFAFDQLPTLCFDHADILADYLEHKDGRRPKPGKNR